MQLQYIVMINCAVLVYVAPATEIFNLPYGWCMNQLNLVIKSLFVYFVFKSFNCLQFLLMVAPTRYPSESQLFKPFLNIFSRIYIYICINICIYIYIYLYLSESILYNWMYVPTWFVQEQISIYHVCMYVRMKTFNIVPFICLAKCCPHGFLLCSLMPYLCRAISQKVVFMCSGAFIEILKYQMGAVKIYIYNYIYTYIYMCVCVCVYIHIYVTVC